MSFRVFAHIHHNAPHLSQKPLDIGAQEWRIRLTGTPAAFCSSAPNLMYAHLREESRISLQVHGVPAVNPASALLLCHAQLHDDVR